MQSLLRSLSSLRAVCSSSGRISARSFSTETASAAADTTNIDGAKSTLHRLLNSAEKPLTSAEVWSLAEQEGLKSKRFMKQMLKQMRTRGHVQTVPVGAGKKHKSFGYLIPDSTAAEAHKTAREGTK